MKSVSFQILLSLLLSASPVSAFTVLPLDKAVSVTSRCALSSSESSSTTSTTTEKYAYLETVREGIEEAGFSDDWKSATEFLSKTLDNDITLAEVCLATALNWKSWAVTTSKFARKYIKPKKPDASTLENSINWLTETGPLKLDDTILRQGIEECPAAFLLQPEENYKKALETAPKEYSDPDAFRELLLRKPAALDRTYNCADEGCNSNCGHCWVSFKLVNKSS